MRTRWWAALLLPAILFFLAACGPLEFSRHAVQAEETLRSTPAEPPVPSPPERKITVRQEIRRQLEAEDYRSALGLLRKRIGEGLPETALDEEYGRALNGLLAEAEQYRKQNLPEKAGELFRSAHDGFPKTEAVAKKIDLTHFAILARIDDCAGQLMERGLVAYRAGNLDEAISSWKLIHTFHPGHQASRKALETAEVQRANLMKVSTQK